MSNEKQIISKINLEVSSIDIPDLKQSIKQQYSAKLEKINSNSIIAKSKKKFNWPLFSTGIAVFSAAVAIITPIIINSFGDVPGVDTSYSPIRIEGKTQQVAYSLVSSTSFLSEFDDVGTSRVAGRKNALSFDELKVEAEKINPYMPIAEGILFNSLNYKVNVEISDLTTYEHKMIIKAPLLENRDFTFYYNETSVADDDDDDEIDEKTEQEFQLNGIVKYNELTYNFEASKEIETDEYELESKIFLDSKSSTYVVMKQEIETENNEKEEKYVYKLYENKVCTESSEVKMVSEQNSKFVVRFKNGAGSNKHSFNVYLNNDKLVIDTEKAEINVTIQYIDNKKFYKYVVGDEEIVLIAN